MFKALDHDGLGDPTHLLERAGLLADAHRLAGELPYGAKKRLELAMALAGISRPTGAEGPSQAKLLLLDEPAAGLSSTERADLMQWVRSLSTAADEYACAVLYTEHNMDAVFGVADRVIVLIEGQIAAQGTPDEVARDPLVRSRYLGSSLHAISVGKHA
jgi:branched-chain amino acid transport system ATP-binding protein